MKKLIIVLPYALFLSFLLGLALITNSNASTNPDQKHSDLSYATYYHTFVPDGSSVIPSCEYVKHTYLDTNLTTGKHFTNYYFTCKETGKNPTMQQQQLWINYVLWHDCKTGSTLACDSDGSD